MVGSKEFDQLRLWLSAIEYKPGVEFEIIIPDSQFGYFAIMVRCNVFDSTPGNTDKMTVLQVIRTVPPNCTADEFYRWLASVLRELEIHEQREWFRWKKTGLPIDDPHAAPGAARVQIDDMLDLPLAMV